MKNVYLAAAMMATPILMGIAITPGAEALPLGNVTGSIEFVRTRLSPCANSEHINFICYKVEARPNVAGSTGVAGLNTATNRISGTGVSNSCQFFAPAQTSCINQAAGNVPSFFLDIVSPGGYNYCLNYDADLTNSVSGAIDFDGGQSCIFIPVN